MKANVWEYSSLDVSKEMDEQAEQAKTSIDERLKLFGRRSDRVNDADVDGMIHDNIFKGASGSLAPMGTYGKSN
jgi:small subunit ribosomal protein S10